jgi:hypothetical protein
MSQTLSPETAGGMAQALGATHRRWANFTNARGRWRGHLFDGRFASVAMDEANLSPWPSPQMPAGASATWFFSNRWARRSSPRTPKAGPD